MKTKEIKDLLRPIVRELITEGEMTKQETEEWLSKVMQSLLAEYGAASRTHQQAMYSFSDATQDTPQKAFRARAQTDNDVQRKKQQAHSFESKRYNRQKPKYCKGGRPHLREATECNQCPLYRNAVLENYFSTLQKLFHLSDR